MMNVGGVGGVLLVLLVAVLLIALVVVVVRRGDGKHLSGMFPGALDIPATADDSGRATPISTAAPADRPRPIRSRHGSVLAEAGKIWDDTERAGQWLFVGDRRTQRLAGDGAPREFYVRVSGDPDMPAGYTIERLTTADYMDRRSGPLDVPVFFVPPTGDIAQGTSKVTVVLVGTGLDAQLHIPPPSEATNQPIIRFPVVSDLAQGELIRLADQLSRAVLLTDDLI